MATAPSIPSPQSSQFLTDSFQRGLAHWNRERLAPQFPHEASDLLFERDLRMRRLEAAFLEELRTVVSHEASSAPRDANDFIAWFEALKHTGHGQGDPLFPWLAKEASREQLRWFFEQEAAGEAGFDDLVAYTQIQMPAAAKLEFARNYWDEMGRGNPRGMHGPMLADLARTLDVTPSIASTVWESLALANAMTAMATNRHYAWHSVGALGVIELTAPDRSAMVAKGLRRIGLTDKERRYFDLHAVLDVKHSEDWNEHALKPLVAEDPRRAVAIAEGALMRLLCGARCFERYRAHLWK
ncbi:iron-containing redox enzyme family protein [Novosphingobium sp. JCM 18896]|uniref:iron-containing redox enzyme family protein n=1 Tax=Novosphingobium sp. JCM 18896 TaxID=2989731 RepID=UPI00222237AA|nr:iron-containing redox enzyme family protein [Novosphingobium sp. JCM 18896]MCW1432166.1 iron-containing redox enzyme family protein [Novosphingobium sp. JCM 18896]